MAFFGVAIITVQRTEGLWGPQMLAACTFRCTCPSISFSSIIPLLPKTSQGQRQPKSFANMAHTVSLPFSCASDWCGEELNTLLCPRVLGLPFGVCGRNATSPKTEPSCNQQMCLIVFATLHLVLVLCTNTHTHSHIYVYIYIHNYT